MLGGIVVNRARRADIAWMFLAAYLGLVALRVMALGQPWTIFVHQFTNGGLLLFAFFMISDPMTIPNRRGARVAYAIIVALGAFLWHFALFKPNGLVWALFFCTPLVPLFDRLWPAEKFEWRQPPQLRGGEMRDSAARPALRLHKRAKATSRIRKVRACGSLHGMTRGNQRFARREARWRSARFVPLLHEKRAAARSFSC